MYSTSTVLYRTWLHALIDTGSLSIYFRTEGLKCGWGSGESGVKGGGGPMQRPCPRSSIIFPPVPPFLDSVLIAW
jgi:hypothetical protein